MLKLSFIFNHGSIDWFMGATIICLLTMGILFVFLWRKASLWKGDPFQPVNRKVGILATLLGTAVWMGLAVSRLIYEFLKQRSSPNGTISAYVIMGFIFTLFFCDLILFLSIILPGGLSSSGTGKEQQEIERKGFLLFLRKPWIASLFMAIFFFLLNLLVFHSGYETDDDISMIMMVAGYLGGKSIPVLYFSNMILGFVLQPLYALHSNINWETWIFIALNFISVWMLLGLLFSWFSKALLRLLFSAIILFSDSYFLLHINFTTMAAFMSLAGICAVLSTFTSKSISKGGVFIVGTFLILAGSLVRIESLLLVSTLTLPTIIFLYRFFNVRRLFLALTGICCLVAFCYLFGDLYLRKSPEWNSFRLYDRTRTLLQDTPRLDTMDAAARSIGWSGNDILLFRHWFFADPITYSLTNLEAVVAQIPTAHSDIKAGLRLLIGHLVNLNSIPYILAILSTWLGMLYYRASRKVILPIFITLSACIVVGVVLALTQKLPFRVFLPILASIAIFEVFIFGWVEGGNEDISLASSHTEKFSQLALIGLALSIFTVFSLVINQAIIITDTNIKHERVYRQMLVDLDDLSRQGRITKKALLVSPSQGIPLHWSNLFFLDLPDIHYLDLGWLTFSPPYYAELHNYEIASIPNALYLNESIYLMSHQEMMQDIVTYIQEHEGVMVSVETIYEFPEDLSNPSDNIFLYRLRPKKCIIK